MLIFCIKCHRSMQASCSEERVWSLVTPSGFEPGSTGCQTCTLNTTQKSQARWYGSQSTYSCEVMAHRHTALTFGKLALALHAHRHSLRIPTTVLLPSRAPHTQVLHPSMGSFTQGSTYLGVPHTVLRARLRSGMACREVIGHHL